MAIFFAGRELIDIAVGIERSGAAFYDYLAESTKKAKPEIMSSHLAGKEAKGRTTHSASKEAKIRTMYSELAAREREHIQTFQNLLGPGGEYPNPDAYAEEYALYLNSLVDSAVFKNERSASEAAQKVASELEAVEIGIRAEKDSILFYSAIQDLIRRADANLIGGIIKEEKSHLAQLSDLKRILSKSPRSKQSTRGK